MWQLLWMFVVACAPPGEAAREVGVGDGRRLAEETARVDNGDGTWSYALAAGSDLTPDVPEGGLFVWQYVGQARYSSERKPLGELTYAHRAPRRESVSEQLLGTRRVDSEGRLWEITEVSPDVDLLDFPTDEPVGDAAETPVADDEVPDPEPGTPISWTPHGWSHENCDADADDEYHLWDAEDREVILVPSGIRRTAIVRLVDKVGFGTCTGTLLRDQWVLTAAHCVLDDAGNEIPDEDLYVYQAWSDEMVDVEFTLPNPDYASTTNPSDDYALVKLKSAFVLDASDMDLSNASDAVLNDVDDRFHNLGYPGFVDHCDDTFDMVHTGNNKITSHPADVVRWKGDGGSGHSGGPIYYCPGGVDIAVCEKDDPGFVIAVWSGWNGFYDRQVGPRTSNFRTWAILMMDTL